MLRISDPIGVLGLLKYVSFYVGYRVYMSVFLALIGVVSPGTTTSLETSLA